MSRARFRVSRKSDHIGQHTERLSAPNIKFPRKRRGEGAGLQFRHITTGRIWTEISETYLKRYLQRDDGIRQWFTRRQIAEHFTAITQQQKECSCGTCRCPHTKLLNEDNVCAECLHGVHVGFSR